MRLYTVEEARALLPQVRTIVQKISATAQALRKRQEVVRSDGKAAGSNGHSHADPWAVPAEGDLERLNHDLQAAVAILERWDIELKDAERGLIDFRSDRDGEVVYLCWMLGEPDIAYWHRIEDGFAGRQPL